MTTRKETLNTCLECAVKHVTMARIQYDEYRQNHLSLMDLAKCIGNLACCELHIIDPYPDLAALCREVRKNIMAAEGKGLLDAFDALVMQVCSVAKLFDNRHGV